MFTIKTTNGAGDLLAADYVYGVDVLYFTPVCNDGETVQLLKMSIAYKDIDSMTENETGITVHIPGRTEETAPAYAMVEGEGAPQYTFDLPDETQLSLL